MRRLSASPTRAAATILAVVALLSCSDSATAPHDRVSPSGSARRTLAPNTPSLSVSQIYGGGGNAGATYTNDFLEIFNPGSDSVSVDGWSVQYASQTGTTWTATPLSGKVGPGAYYLVQEAMGSGGTTPLPTPDATGTIAMSGTDGKVILASQATAFASSICSARST